MRGARRQYGIPSGGASPHLYPLTPPFYSLWHEGPSKVRTPLALRKVLVKHESSTHVMTAQAYASSWQVATEIRQILELPPENACAWVLLQMHALHSLVCPLFARCYLGTIIGRC